MKANDSKNLLLFVKIALGILLGGFFLPSFLPKSDAVSDFWVRVFLAAFIITILNPFPKMMRELGRIYLNPTILPAYLGILWPAPIFIIIHYTNADIDFNGYLLWICVPSLFLMGLSGFFMVQRNEYVGRRPMFFGGLNPAKPYGYFYMIVFWGTAILLIIAVILHWF